MKIIYFNLC